MKHISDKLIIPVFYNAYISWLYRRHEEFKASGFGPVLGVRPHHWWRQFWKYSRHFKCKLYSKAWGASI